MFRKLIYFRPQVKGGKKTLSWAPLKELISITGQPLSKSKLYYDRRSAGQSVLEQSTHLGLMTRSWLLSDSCRFVDLGRPFWQEDGSAVCNCYWPSPAQLFSGPSPLGFVAIFYCLRFETSNFVASYDSQGHGGGMTNFCRSWSYVTTDNQPASLSWNKALFWDLWPDLYYCLTVAGLVTGTPSLTRRRICRL
jgi:hypothetical protein